MKFSAITQDQVLILDGEPEHCGIVGGFSLPSGEWAIHYNGAFGEVEYLDNRPNENINKATFDKRYGYLLEIHATAKAERERQQAEMKAAAEAAANEQQKSGSV